MTFNVSKYLHEEHIVLYHDCDEKFLKERYINSTKVIKYTEIVDVNGRKPDFLSDLKCIDLDTALSYESVLIVLAVEDFKNIKNAVAKIGEKPFDHITHFGPNINVHVLKIMGYDDYYDFCNNHITFDKSLTGICTVTRFDNGSFKNNVVRIGNIRIVNRLEIVFYGHNGYVVIGNGNSFVQTRIEITTKGNVIIGDDNMFSWRISLQQPDHHLIFDVDTRKRINKYKNITIGNHVWVGTGVVLLGGGDIPDNCIIGYGSITSRKFTETNCVLAGAPAKIVRRNVLWSRDNQRFDYNDFSQCQDQTALKYMTADEERRF